MIKELKDVKISVASVDGYGDKTNSEISLKELIEELNYFGCEDIPDIFYDLLILEKEVFVYDVYIEEKVLDYPYKVYSIKKGE